MWLRFFVYSIVGYAVFLCCRLTWILDLHKTVYNHQPGPCKLVLGICRHSSVFDIAVDQGSEDIEVLPNGLAFISSGIEIGPVDPSHKLRRGNIFLFDFNKPDEGAQALTIVGELDRAVFSPHGLSIWSDSNRNLTYIFVVNHLLTGKDVVEKFRFDEKTRKLHHVRTYEEDTTFSHLNGILATGEDSFYFTRDYGFAIAVEIFLGLRLGSIVFYDGTAGRVVMDGLDVPNGINGSPDGNHVYVATTKAKTLLVYARKSDNSLELKQFANTVRQRIIVSIILHTAILQEVLLGSLLDNVDVELSTGDLWVGAHPSMRDLVNYMTPPYTSKSPSQVLRLTVSDGGSKVTNVTEVYSDDGLTFSGSSVAVHYNGQMLVGSVYTDLLLCQFLYA